MSGLPEAYRSNRPKRSLPWRSIAVLASPVFLIACSEPDEGLPPTLFGQVVTVEEHTGDEFFQTIAVCQEQADGSVDPVTSESQLHEAIEAGTLTAEGSWTNDSRTAGIACGIGDVTTSPSPVGTELEINLR